MSVQTVETYTHLLYRLGFDITSNIDLNWYQFVIDHLLYIKSTCQFVIPSAETICKYEYYPELYLKEKTQSPQHVWIFYLVNQLTCEMDFTYENVKNGLYLPLSVELSQLYEQYQSSSPNRIIYPIGEGITGPVNYTSILTEGLQIGT